MGPSLVQFILLTEEHEEFTGGVERQFEVDEVSDELAGCVEDDVLAEDFRDSHGLLLLRGLCLFLGLSCCAV